MTFVTFTLIAHILIGLIGIGASYMVVMGLLKSKLHLRFLFVASLTALLSFVISWLSAGYYYIVHYGGAVKPIIKAGPYPWAHAFFTEVKEHVFLFLPFLSLITFLMIAFMGPTLEEDRNLRRVVMLIALLTFLIGVYITVSGMVMSGSVR